MKLKFLDERTTKSVRKFLAYTSGILFATSCIWTMVINKGDLSSTQYSIIAGVYGFYFLKQLFQKENNGATK